MPVGLSLFADRGRVWRSWLGFYLSSPAPDWRAEEIVARNKCPPRRSSPGRGLNTSGRHFVVVFQQNQAPSGNNLCHRSSLAGIGRQHARPTIKITFPSALPCVFFVEARQ